MSHAIVLDEDAVNRLSLCALPDDWAQRLDVPPETVGLSKSIHDGIVYFVGANGHKDSRLLVIQGQGPTLFCELPDQARLECFYRVLRAALSRFQTGVRIPIEWRIFHSESLISFQTNRWSLQLRTRVYADLAPEATDHVYVFTISTSDSTPLTRIGYDAELFTAAVLNYEEALKDSEPGTVVPANGQISIALTRNFSDSNIVQGIPYHIWRSSRLTREQLAFFDAPFEGPLRVRGAAGTGKTLVLTMRFLKEIYARLDRGEHLRAAFIAHGQETVDQIRHYLMQIDERNLITDPPKSLDMQITTLHSIADQFINFDNEAVQPLSLDGTEGRTLQYELVNSISLNFSLQKSTQLLLEGTRSCFRSGLMSPADAHEHKGFCCDLIDEFANVLETFGTKEVDEIAERYIRTSSSPRGLSQTPEEKHIVLELYREFRKELASMDVVSLDQFLADFLDYLHSFRWQAVRHRRGFDFVFADELHLFNRQERPVLGYLLRNPRPPRVALAYDPRQSPRNSFFPESRIERDNIWTEAHLDTDAKQFELTSIFRYTPEIMKFIHGINLHFPADDLAEEWGLPKFGASAVASGPRPKAYLYSSRDAMGKAVALRARELARRAKRGQRVAVLCLDPRRFALYEKAGLFKDEFIIVSGRDQMGKIQNYPKRPVLSMPEHVAGLQFEIVLLTDANAALVGELGAGINGLQRFISGVYLGASRAKSQLELYADALAGGFAQPIRDATGDGLIDFVER